MQQPLAREDLAGSGGAAQASGKVQGRPPVAVANRDGLPGVDADSHPQRRRRIACELVGEGRLEVHRAAQGMTRGLEDGEGLVAAELHELAVPRLDPFRHDLGEAAGEP